MPFSIPMPSFKSTWTMARQQALRGSGRPGGGAVGLRQRFGADLDVWGLPCRPAPCPSSAGATPGAAGAAACATAGCCCNFSHSARMRPAAAASLRWRVFPAVQPATIWPSKARAKMCVATRNSAQRPSHSAADAQANA